MTVIAEAGTSLFAETLPSLDDIKKLAVVVRASEKNRQSFLEQVEQNLGKSNAESCLATGIGLYILNMNERAVERLQRGGDCKEKFIYLAYALRRLGRFEEALASLDKAREHGAEELSVLLEKTATLRYARRCDEAAEQLKRCSNFERVSAEYHYQLARLQGMQGLYEKAMDNYRVALELEPMHHKALFHLAYACDLRGDEEAAIDYYKQITLHSPVYTSALLNLAVLYEDVGKYDEAVKCVELVLKSHPNHQRAVLFKKDIESSKTMIYDEEREKKIDRKNKILETPITDFELSVRSRNCLKKMNIRTIGDLLRTTETDLLGFKNFGETSLSEIKAILVSKGLHLGMALEDTSLMTPEQTVLEPEEASDRVLDKAVDEIELSVRSRKCLASLGIKTLGELTQKTEAELLGCKNFGVTSLNEIMQRLAEFGLSLRKLE